MTTLLKGTFYVFTSPDSSASNPKKQRVVCACGDAASLSLFEVAPDADSKPDSIVKESAEPSKQGGQGRIGDAVPVATARTLWEGETRLDATTAQLVSQLSGLRWPRKWSAIRRFDLLVTDEIARLQREMGLNRCLGDAITGAVTELNYQRDSQVADRHSQDLNQRLGFFAHELRNLLTSAMLAQSLIKGGSVALGGATGAVLDRSLVGMRNLIDRSLAEVRISAEIPVQHQLFSLFEFIAEVKITAGLESPVPLCEFSVAEVDPALWVDADRDLLFSALGNLLQNAFKFTRMGSKVTLRAHASGERILIDVEDNGPGLPAGEAQKMFLPFTQAGEDRSGLGLGLSIAKRGTEANRGTLRVCNKVAPDAGCVFTIELPRHNAPETMKV